MPGDNAEARLDRRSDGIEEKLDRVDKQLGVHLAECTLSNRQNSLILKLGFIIVIALTIGMKTKFGGALMQMLGLL